MVFYDILIFVFSLIILVKGADFLVDGSSRLARKIGINEFIIGLTLVSIGTSLPEFATSIAASFKSESGLIMGNIVGSNIANILLIFAFGIFMIKFKIKENFYKKDCLFMIAITFLFFLLSIDRVISFYDSLLMFILFVLYIIYLFRNKINYYNVSENISINKSIIFVIIGLIGLYYGAKLLVPSTVSIAELFNIKIEIISAFLIAVGTSVPELLVTISSARKKLEKILIGNIIGSNIANILLIIGVSGMINNMEVSKISLYYFMPVMILTSLIFYNFIRNNFDKRIVYGTIFIAIYILFLIFSIVVNKIIL